MMNGLDHKLVGFEPGVEKCLDSMIQEICRLLAFFCCAVLRT